MFRSLLLLSGLIVSSYALVHAVDSASLVPVATYQKARAEGFTKAIIRGYQEACGIGGQVDPNFVPSYNNARSAGYTDIDTYWFPCNGSGNKCKSYATQLSELAQTFKAHSMNIGTIWIDFEKDAAICNNWNYGTSGNQQQARSLLEAMKNSGFNFGIYSSPGEWGTLFGSTGFILDNTAPLWFATYNNVETLTLGTPFGGWNTAVGHQYTDVSASKLFDLSVFAH
ncbi:putative GH family 25 lysozyme 4 [Psilocybe cubensis]|uniref:Glycoside hydrolase family 25 protein n=2 Tax=Psilocybe cubensis TaxID=181762 RepID=A0A8H8CHA7_PSICU|nr:putative GH family 25 lysozyme 4 [Psilocybe cubensis]KAH9474386.1 putative GH family 25 lysozyme 4 [Psilocybe cubensis]